MERHQPLMVEPTSNADAPPLQGPALDQVTRVAKATFGTEEKAQKWLHRPTTALSGSTPLDVASASASGWTTASPSDASLADMPPTIR